MNNEDEEKIRKIAAECNEELERNIAKMPPPDIVEVGEGKRCMNTPSFLELWQDHYETLDENRRVAFLLNLKREGYAGNVEAMQAFLHLAQKWIIEPVAHLQ